MNRIAIFLAMTVLSTSAIADLRNPHHKYNLTSTMTSKTTITVIVADNVQQACEKESRRIGNNGFNHQIQACAFWQKDTCTVILPRHTSTHQAGHEFLHCIKGEYH
jgi:hypothetical protein